MIADPATPQYVVAKCIGTLATMLRRRDKRLAEKAAAAATRKAAKPVPHHNVLPSNGREPKDWKPSGPVKSFKIPAGINRG
jgi:hypothetical protein